MLFDELAEKWIDSIEERVRKTTLCTYRASLSRAMRYLEGKEIGTSLIKSYPFLCIPIICCCTARSARFVYLRAAEEEVNRTSPCGGHTRRKRGW